MTVRRHEVTAAQWQQLKPLLAELVPRKPKTGRPNLDHRRILNGILWKLKTGAPWRDLPARYGPWSTVYSRFWRWQRMGIWDWLFAAVQRQEDAAGHVDQPPYLRLRRRRPIGAEPHHRRRPQILLHRVPGQPAAPRDRPLRLARLPAADHFLDLHATQLPIAHPAHLICGGRDGAEPSRGWPNPA
jgi:transposase